jgi:pyroglutamyl-peptidase
LEVKVTAVPEMTEKSVLLIGFGDGGVEWLHPNPSELVVRSLNGTMIAGASVTSEVLPPDSSTTATLVDRAVREARADVVLGFGVFPGIPGLQVERLAVNVMDFQRPTLGDYLPRGEPVCADGPPAYFATVPVKAMVAAVRDAGVPARVSNSASTHGCNQTLYLELYVVEREHLSARAGFIHLPNLPEHSARARTWEPSMSLETMLAGVKAAIQSAVETKLDIVANLEPWEW